jgi:hypothetical protein
VEVLVVLGGGRIIGVATEDDAGETGDESKVGERKSEGVPSTGTSLGKGIPDSSVKGVVMAGSVPR